MHFTNHPILRKTGCNWLWIIRYNEMEKIQKEFENARVLPHALKLFENDLFLRSKKQRLQHNFCKMLSYCTKTRDLLSK